MKKLTCLLLANLCLSLKQQNSSGGNSGHGYSLFGQFNFSNAAFFSPSNILSYSYVGTQENFE